MEKLICMASKFEHEQNLDAARSGRHTPHFVGDWDQQYEINRAQEQYQQRRSDGAERASWTDEYTKAIDNMTGKIRYLLLYFFIFVWGFPDRIEYDPKIQVIYAVLIIMAIHAVYLLISRIMRIKKVPYKYRRDVPNHGTSSYFDKVQTRLIQKSPGYDYYILNLSYGRIIQDKILYRIKDSLNRTDVTFEVMDKFAKKFENEVTMKNGIIDILVTGSPNNNYTLYIRPTLKSML